MLKPILKSETLTIGGQEITLHELSALAYLEYQKYLADNPMPNGQDRLELEKALINVYSRAIAHSLAPSFPEESVDSIQAYILKNFCNEALATLHRAVVKLCGWKKEPSGDDSNTGSDEGDASEEEQEPADPKSE